MSDCPTRLVGNRHWREFSVSPLEALERGACLDAVDAEKERKRQLWFQENTKCIVVE